jgi:hypothetical protein
LSADRQADQPREARRYLDLRGCRDLIALLVARRHTLCFPVIPSNNFSVLCPP